MYEQKIEFDRMIEGKDKTINLLETELNELKQEIKNLQFDLDNADQKCLLIFEKEKISFNQRVVHL